ncbi:MAG TPA: putative maltokinase [Terriglobia bacterium]|nr:putative maltokinase [Terriglobia bacterium]
MEFPNLTVSGDWESVLNSQPKTKLEEILPNYLCAQRWFGGKARRISSVNIEDAVRIPYGPASADVTFVRVNYLEGGPETYVLPLAFVSGSEGEKIRSESPSAVVARVTAQGRDGVLVNAMQDQKFCSALLDMIGGGKTFRSGSGAEVRGTPTHVFGRLAGREASRLAPSLARAEQSNSSILYGGQLILKVFRRLSEGINPDLEVGAFLTDAGFAHVPPVAGFLEYRRITGEPITLGILQGFIRCEGDAWSFTLEALSQYYARAAAYAGKLRPEIFPKANQWVLEDQGAYPEGRELIGAYMAAVELLGRRTAELHLALASDQKNPDFAPEPFSPSYQRSLHQSMRDLAIGTFQLLEQRLPELPEGVKQEAGKVRALEAQVLDRFQLVRDRGITAMRTRVHGDYHLGQVLYTGDDFVIIDFEGEPARPISERRIKRSPLRDVAGMLRSFHYAAYGALLDRIAAKVVPAAELAAFEPWANGWYAMVSSAFVKTYLEVAAQARFLPQGREELVALLDAYQLEKAIYEMAYELNNRPDWLRIPLRGILHMLGNLK